MDPTDARRLVRDLCARLGFDPDLVLSRDRTADVSRMRRVVVLELVRVGVPIRQVSAALHRSTGTIADYIHPRPRFAVRLAYRTQAGSP